jgi:hypothetical protein
MPHSPLPSRLKALFLLPLLPRSRESRIGSCTLSRITVFVHPGKASGREVYVVVGMESTRPLAIK